MNSEYNTWKGTRLLTTAVIRPPAALRFARERQRGGVGAQCSSVDSAQMVASHSSAEQESLHVSRNS
jgi:hypothetical protein